MSGAWSEPQEDWVGAVDPCSWVDQIGHPCNTMQVPIPGLAASGAAQSSHLPVLPLLSDAAPGMGQEIYTSAIPPSMSFPPNPSSVPAISWFEVRAVSHLQQR